MKGYRMVLLVNGGLLLFVALSALLLSLALEPQVDRCTTQTPDDPGCAQTRDAATTALRVSPFLTLAGLILLGLGAILGREREATKL